MGLFNKLFPINKTNNKHQDISINYLEEQVRVLLFRECEYKGRKVLFDSLKKNIKNGSHKEHFPSSNGTPSSGALPHPHNQLAEMVFGSVAMGFNTCCFKIHLLQPTIQLMFTQVFPSPRHREKVRESFSSSSSQCLEQSIVFEDSATSSTNSSASDQLSTYSSASDQILGDSLSSLSSGNVYKKWLRSNNCLNHNSGSSFGSVRDGVLISSHHRSSKLGFVLIVDVPEVYEEPFIDFCMEHISLFESLMYRSRRLIEIAYTKPYTFESSMEEVARISVQGIQNLVTSPNLAFHTQIHLQSNCDIHSVAFRNIGRVTLASRGNFLTRMWKDVIGTKSLSEKFTRTKKNDECDVADSKCVNFGNFVNEFCELLEATDNKNTSFFISSLITAVLTHHLGWVQSSINISTPENLVYNALWFQLLNLYGAIGHPSKLSQTIVMGNSDDIMTKVLNCLAYFIRCCDIEKNEIYRTHINEENKIAKNVYEKYYTINNKFENFEIKKCLDNINNNYLKVDSNGIKPLSKIGFAKSKSFSKNLSEICNSEETDLNTFQNNNVEEESNNLLNIAKPKGLLKTKSFANNLLAYEPSENNGKCMKSLTEHDYNKFNNNTDIVIENNLIVNNKNEDVVFVLGDNDTLVGINKNQIEDIIHSNDSEIMKKTNKSLDHSTSLENLCCTVKPPHVVPKILEKSNSDINLCPPVLTANRKSYGRINISQNVTNSTMVINNLAEEKPSNKMRIIRMPMPRSKKQTNEVRSSPNILSVFKGITQQYMPDMVLQGTLRPKVEWIYKLKNDLALTSQQTQFGKYVEEVVAILANINTWEVHLMSSHTYVIDPNATGIRVYMSQLVANMLESLYVMWKLKVPVKNCMLHMENKLQEICIRSQTLAQLLLKTPFCSMEILNSTLHLDVNDVPLLMAIASVHTPEVTKKYGLSFQ